MGGGVPDVQVFRCLGIIFNVGAFEWLCESVIKKIA